MNENETLQWLKINFSRFNYKMIRQKREEMVDNAYKKLVSNEINLNTPIIQSHIMNNWWNEMFSILIQDLKDERLTLLINKLNWNELININFPLQMRDPELRNSYIGEKISWLQFGFLSDPNIVRNAENHLKNFQGVFDLVNSKKETSWHVLARALKINLNINGPYIVDLMSLYCEKQLMKKDGNGKTILDILQDNIVYNKNSRERPQTSLTYPEESLKRNIELLSIVNKLILDNNLPEKKNKAKLKI